MKKQKINIQTAALSTAALLGLASPALAQNVSISPTGNAPDNSAALDIRDFTDKGILIPRIALTGTTSAGPISNPANSLLVYNTTNNPAAGLTPGYYYNAGTTTSPIWVRLLNGGTPSDAWLTRGNAGTNPSTHFIGTTDNVDLVFRTNNTEKMRITAGGNVGIGTTTPGDKVEINGRLFLNYAGTPMIRLRTNVNFGGSTKGITEHQIFGPYNTSAGTLGALYIGAGKSSDDTKNEIILYNLGCNGPGGTNDCNVRRIRLLGDTIYASGNVGIGTAVPKYPLSFGSALANTKLAIWDGGAGGTAFGLGVQNHQFRFHVNQPSDRFSFLNGAAGTEIVTILGSGNVGIGTTTPLYPLHVVLPDNPSLNGIRFEGLRSTTVGHAVRLELTAPNSPAAADNKNFQIINVNPSVSGGENYLLFRSVTDAGALANVIMALTHSGNVGIGTTTPGAKLQIAGGAVRLDAPQGAPYGYSIRIGSGWGSWARAYGFHSSADAELAAFGAYGSGNTLTYAFIGPGATAHNSPWMVITNTGNVGIGTTTPSQKLSVVGNICATGNINGNSATCGSDIRWKKDLKPLENTLEKISQLKPVYYYWKKDEFPDKHFTDKRQIGLIAQDMQKVFPELVVEDKEGYLSVDYSRFTSVLLKAIQEQQQIIHEQQQQIQEQQQQIHDQQKIIQELQAENAQIKAENAQIKAENAQIKTENAQTKSELKALAEKMNILINTLSAEKKVGNK